MTMDQLGKVPWYRLATGKLHEAGRLMNFYMACILDHYSNVCWARTKHDVTSVAKEMRYVKDKEVRVPISAIRNKLL